MRKFPEIYQLKARYAALSGLSPENHPSCSKKSPALFVSHAPIEKHVFFYRRLFPLIGETKGAPVRVYKRGVKWGCSVNRTVQKV